MTSAVTSRSIRSMGLTIVVGLLISAIGVWLVARDIDLGRLAQALGSAHYEWVVAGIAAIGLTFVVRARRWAILLSPVTYRTSTIISALLVGQVLNFLLPLRVGDVVRSVLLSRASGSSVERVLGSVAIEKAWDWIALTVILAIVTLVDPLPDWFSGPARSVGFVAAIILLIFVVVVFTPRRLWLHAAPHGSKSIDRVSGRWSVLQRLAVRERVQRLLDSLSALRSGHAIARVVFWSGVTWLLGVVTNVAVMRAFGVDSWPAAMLWIVVLMIGVAVPPSIAALGIFEALSVLALTAFGIPNETALAIGLTLHVIVFVPQTIAAVLALVRQKPLGLTHPMPALLGTLKSSK